MSELPIGWLHSNANGISNRACEEVTSWPYFLRIISTYFPIKIQHSFSDWCKINASDQSRIGTYICLSVQSQEISQFFYRIFSHKFTSKFFLKNHAIFFLKFFILVANKCLTSLTRAKCGTRSTLCWKVGNISGSTELFAL